jgi:hypothetical protein
MNAVSLTAGQIRTASAAALMRVPLPRQRLPLQPLLRLRVRLNAVPGAIRTATATTVIVTPTAVTIAEAAARDAPIKA